MVSRVLYSLVCVFCVILLPAVWADHCSSYWDTDGHYHDSQQCLGSQFCCGDCNQKFCCAEKKYSLPQEKQESCLGRSSYYRGSNTAVMVGSILGAVFPIVLCVALIICCVAPCCLFYKKCRKGRNQRHQSVGNTITVVNAPQQPPSSFGHQPFLPGYQPVVGLPGHGGYGGYGGHGGYGGRPVPTAPPSSYIQATDPAHPPVDFSPEYPMALFPNQPYAPPPYSDELAQPPYNPSHCLN